MDVELNVSTEGEGENSKSKARKCGICNQKGHNARICPNDKN